MTSPMSGRWVCKRCFSANDASAAVCAQCGLQRGAQASADDQATYAASGAPAGQPGPAPGRDQGRRRWLQYAWIPILAIVGIGLFLFGGKSAVSLEVGDCFDSPEDQAEIESVDDKPCTEPHRYEVFHVFEWEGPTEQYPPEAELNEFIAQECLPAFEAYVGLSYEQSKYDVQTLVPSEESWDDGDHEFVCSAYDPSNAQLTASVRNSGE